MPDFALLKDGKFVERRTYQSKPADIAHKGVTWLPYRRAVMPTIDPATEVLTGPTITVEATEVVESYSKRAKTAGEIDAEKDDRISSFDKLAFAVMFDMENRVRVLEGKPQITALQYRTALKARL